MQDEWLALCWAGDERELGTRRGVGVACDDEGDCGGHFGAKAPADHARFAGRLFGGVEEEAEVVPTAVCECGCAGIRELSGGVWGVRRGTDAVCGEEGVDGDKVGGVVEEGKGKGADGEEGTDKGGEVAEGCVVCGVRGVEGAGAVEKEGVGVARGCEAHVERAGAGESTETEHVQKWKSRGDGGGVQKWKLRGARVTTRVVEICLSCPTPLHPVAHSATENRQSHSHPVRPPPRPLPPASPRNSQPVPDQAQACRGRRLAHRAL